MKRKLTWMCIFVLTINSIFGFCIKDLRAEEDIATPEITENEIQEEEKVQKEDSKDDSNYINDDSGIEDPYSEHTSEVKTFVVETEPVEPVQSTEIKSFTVHTEPVEQEHSTEVKTYTVETVPVEQPGDNEVHTFLVETVSESDVSEDLSGTLSGDKTVSEDETVSGNMTVSGDETVSADEADVNSLSGDIAGEILSDNNSGKGFKDREVDDEVISVVLPVMDESDTCFNYITDPAGMIEKTNAARYEGKDFQNGATVFFKNKTVSEDAEGIYTDTSDFKLIQNKSNVPIKVTVSMQLSSAFSDGTGIKICEDSTFKGIEEPALAFSLIDKNGNEVPVNEAGEAVMEVTLKAVPDDVYIYRYDSEIKKYRLHADFDEDTKIDEFEFAVKGWANPDADWSEVVELPIISISWFFEPEKIDSGEGGLKEEVIEHDDDIEETVTNEDTEENVSDNLISDNASENAADTADTGDGASEKDNIEIEKTENEDQAFEGEIKGYGTLEGVADKNLVMAILPSAREDMFKFIMDPQGLIDKTNGVAYPGKTFEKGQTLFFTNMDENSEYDLSSKSDAQRIINRGIKPLKVSVSVSMPVQDGDDNISLAERKDFSGYPFSQVYLSIVSGNGEALEGVKYTDNGCYVEYIISGNEPEAYDLSWKDGVGYTYSVSSDRLDENYDFPEFEFRLEGATNEEADWSRLKKDNLTVDVIWSVKTLEDDEESAEDVTDDLISEEKEVILREDDAFYDE